MYFLFHRLLKKLQKGGFGTSVGSSVNGGSDGGSTQILPAEGAQSMIEKMSHCRGKPDKNSIICDQQKQLRVVLFVLWRAKTHLNKAQPRVFSFKIITYSLCNT